MISPPLDLQRPPHLLARKPILRASLIIVASLLSIVLWDSASSISFVMVAHGWVRNEQMLYLVDKGSFVLALALGLTIWRGWRRFGFTGGLQWRFWPLLLPLWISAVAAILHGFSLADPLNLFGWAVLALAIAIGEETVFRGFIIDALLGSPAPGQAIGVAAARRTVVISALLFGAMHMVGIFVPEMDRHVVVAQALFATGIGLALAWVRLRSASIWPGLIAHATLDALGIVASGGVSNAFAAPKDGLTGLWVTDAVALVWGIALVTRPAVPSRPPA